MEDTTSIVLRPPSSFTSCRLTNPFVPEVADKIGGGADADETALDFFAVTNGGCFDTCSSRLEEFEVASRPSSLLSDILSRLWISWLAAGFSSKMTTASSKIPRHTACSLLWRLSRALKSLTLAAVSPIEAGLANSRSKNGSFSLEEKRNAAVVLEPPENSGFWVFLAQHYKMKACIVLQSNTQIGTERALVLSNGRILLLMLMLRILWPVCRSVVVYVALLLTTCTFLLSSEGGRVDRL